MTYSSLKTNPYTGILDVLQKQLSWANFCSGQESSEDKQNIGTGISMAEKERVDLKASEKLPEHLSVQAAHIAEIHNVPMKVLIRPFPSQLDEKKVLSLMETIEVS